MRFKCIYESYPKKNHVYGYISNSSKLNEVEHFNTSDSQSNSAELQQRNNEDGT